MSQAQTTIPSDTPGARQWLRKISLIAGDAKGNGIDLSNMRIVFEVNSMQSLVPATLSAHIYNLSDSTADMIQNLPHLPVGEPIVLGGAANPVSGKVILQAGYASNYGIIFAGEIVQVRNRRESGTDTVTDIFAGDGDYLHSWGVINSTLAAGWSAPDVNNEIRKSYVKSGVPSPVSDLPDNMPNKNQRAPRGRVLFGMTRDTAEQLGSSNQTACFYDKGTLSWVPQSSVKPGEVVVLTGKTGMIGYPTQTNFGIAVKCLLNPSIGVGSRIWINNKSIQRAQFATPTPVGNDLANMTLASNLSPKYDGVYKVLAVKHTGDTRGNEWYSEIQAMALHQEGPTYALTPQEYLYLL